MSNSFVFFLFPPFRSAHPLSFSCSEEITDNNLLKRLFLSIWRDAAECPHTHTQWDFFLTFKDVVLLFSSLKNTCKHDFQ